MFLDHQHLSLKNFQIFLEKLYEYLLMIFVYAFDLAVPSEKLDAHCAADAGLLSAHLSATPGINVVPTGAGIEVHVRYITRAYERHDARKRLYDAVVQLMHGKREAVSTSSN